MYHWFSNRAMKRTTYHKRRSVCVGVKLRVVCLLQFIEHGQNRFATDSNTCELFAQLCSDASEPLSATKSMSRALASLGYLACRKRQTASYGISRAGF